MIYLFFPDIVNRWCYLPYEVCMFITNGYLRIFSENFLLDRLLLLFC